MTLTLSDNGHLNSDHIKFLRLTFNGNPPSILAKVQGIDKLTAVTGPLTQTMLQTHIRI